MFDNGEYRVEEIEEPYHEITYNEAPNDETLYDDYQDGEISHDNTAVVQVIEPSQDSAVAVIEPKPRQIRVR